MVTEARTEHPHIVVVRRAGGDRAIIKGTSLSVSLIATLFNRGETPAGLLSLYPNLSPGAMYDAISYYFDHKVDIDQEIHQDTPDQVLTELRRDAGLTEVSPGRFQRKKAFGSGV
ncbi:MAG: DUF433 domain-containing protein [Candidatus Marsarchaeota archaeon]|nr:DUF433 domain-containing protein [Candidatus Marsarchaeota archaeon]